METEFVLSLGEQRWTLPAGADTITIGRASNADIRLQADDQISRIHARLTRDATTWILHDESRNGTGLNGHRITTPTPLTTGDRIHIGRSVLTFHKSTTPSPTPPATTPSAAHSTPSAPPSTPAPPAPGPSAEASFPPIPDPGAQGDDQHPALTPPAERDHASGAAFPADPGTPAEQLSTARAFPDDSAPGAQGDEYPALSGSAAAPMPEAGFPPIPAPDAQRDQHPAPAPLAERDHPLAGAAFPADPGTPDEQLSTGRAYPDDPAPDARRHQPSSAAPAYPPDALSAPDDVRRAQPPTPASSHRADPVPAAHGRQDQAAAGAAFPADPFAADPVSTPDNHALSGAAPDHHAPAATNPFTPDDRAPADTAPFAPNDRASAGTNRSTADDHAQASTNPFTADDPAPASTNPFAPNDHAPADANPFAPNDPAPAGTNTFSSNDHAAAGTNRSTADDHAPAGANPFTADDHAPAGANPFAPNDPAPAGTNPFAPGGRGSGGASPLGDGEDVDRGDEYDVAGVVPGFDGRDGAARSGDGGAWAAYPSADNPEPVRSPWEISAQIDQSEPNWNASDSWPDATPPTTDRRTPPDHRATTDRRASAADRRTAGSAKLPRTTDDADAVGTVRLARVLIAAGGVIVLGLIVNLIITFLADGPGSALRWLVPPGIALIAGMALALTDAAAPKHHRPGRLDVSVLIAIAVVLVGVGVGGFALTAGTEYVAGYLTGNESGEDRLIKPVAKATNGITVTVENVTYTGHFTRIEVTVANAAEQAVTIPLDGTTFTAADGTALRADTGKSAWPSRIASGGSEHGTITFKGHLPDSATTAVLTFKSGDTTFTVPGVTLSQ